MRQPFGRLRDHHQPLLVAQGAREQGHHRAGRDAQLFAVGTLALERPHVVDVDPVREEANPVRLHALEPQVIEHARRDGRNGVEATKDLALDPAHQAAREAPLEQTHLERHIDFEVLNVQPGASPAQAGREPPHGRANKSRRHGEHHVGPPERLHQHHRHRRGGKREQVQHPLEAARLGRHPQRRTPHASATDHFLAIGWPGVARAELPGRVVRRSRHHAHVMPLSGQPLGHFARVLADARRLGSKVRAVDQDLHVLT